VFMRVLMTLKSVKSSSKISSKFPPDDGLCNRCRRLDYISPVSNGSRERFHRGLSRREEIWMLRRMSRMSNGLGWTSASTRDHWQR
jgi:hypothetical protein